MKTRRIFSAVADTTAVLLFLFLIVFPQYATEPTRFALSFCAKTLVPSLFIYMVLSKMIITLPITDRLTEKFGYEAVALIAGNLCGCPIGAKNALSLYETNRISKKHAEYLCSFTNNASVSFVIGFVGSELFGDIKVGLRIFIYQTIASVITAIVMKFIIFGKDKLPKPSRISAEKVGLRASVTDSVLTVINVCGCATFFIVCGSAASMIFELNEFWSAILKSLLEFSSGCAATAVLSRFAIQATAFSVGFTGLSVALQVRSVISNKLAMMPFLTGKLITVSVMTFLSVIFG